MVSKLQSSPSEGRRSPPERASRPASSVPALRARMRYQGCAISSCLAHHGIKVGWLTGQAGGDIAKPVRH